MRHAPLGALLGALLLPQAASAGCVYPIPATDRGAAAQASHAIGELSHILNIATEIHSGVQSLNSAGGWQSLLSLGGMALPQGIISQDIVDFARDPVGEALTGVLPSGPVHRALLDSGLRLDGNGLRLPDSRRLARSLGGAIGLPQITGTHNDIWLLTGLPAGGARHRLGTLGDLVNPGLRDVFGEETLRTFRLSGLDGLDIASVAQGRTGRLDAFPRRLLLGEARRVLGGNEAGELIRSIERETGLGLWDVAGYLDKVERPHLHGISRDRILRDLSRHPLLQDASGLASWELRWLAGAVQRDDLEGALRALSGSDLIDERFQGTIALAKDASRQVDLARRGRYSASDAAWAIERIAASLPQGSSGRAASACIQAQGCDLEDASRRGWPGASSPTWLGREARRRGIIDAAIRGDSRLAERWLLRSGEEMLRHRPCHEEAPPSEERIEARAEPRSSSGEEAPTDVFFLHSDEEATLSEVKAKRQARKDHLGAVALDAWAVAKAERQEGIRLHRKLEVLSSRIENCEDAACEMRVAADAARIRAATFRRRAELEIEALRLEQATSLVQMPIYRHGSADR